MAATVIVYFAVFGLEMLTRRAGMDELLTGWMISGSFAESISRSATHQGQSPLYFMGLWIWKMFFGSSMVALRLPSLLAHIATTWHLRALGTSMVNRRAGTIAAIIFLGINENAVDARPYSFLLLGVVLSVRGALAWSESPTMIRGVLWAAAAAFVLYMHPFAIYALLVQVLFLLRGRENGARLRDMAFVAVMSVLFVLPMVPQVLQLSERQGTLVIVNMPKISEYLSEIVSGSAWVALVVAVIVNRGFLSHAVDVPRWTLFAFLWAVLPATGLFVQSALSGSSVFVPRYMIGAVPGMAMLTGIAISVLADKRAAIAGLTAFIIAISVMLTPVASPNWEPAADIIADAPDALIVTMSGYIELANSEAFPTQGDANEYFNGPLRWVGVSASLHSIPRDAREQDKQTIEATLLPAIQSRQSVVLADLHRSKRSDGPLYVEALLREADYRVDVVDSSTGVRTTRFVAR
jgi:uncharacterized membrane protein